MRKFCRSFVALQFCVLHSLLFSSVLPAQEAIPEFSAQETSIENPRQVREDLQMLRTELARIEAEFDAYNPAIAELSSDIGNRLAARGIYEEALVAYRRALHVLRINEGLDTEKQIPILESIVQTHYRGGEYEEAGESLERLSRLYSKTFDRMHPDMIPHLTSRGDWHLGAYHLGVGRNGLQHLIEAHNAFDRVADIQAASGMPYDPSLYSLLSSINYQMAVYAEHSQSTTFNSGEAQTPLSGLSNFAGNSYRRGKSLLERALHAAEQSENVSDEITALVQLADWEQLFRKRFSARDKYVAAYEKLQLLENEGELAGLFSQPRLLPDFELADRVQFPEGRQAAEVPVTMDVSAWGTSRNVKVVRDQDGENSSRAERLAVRTANSSMYRPAIMDGEPVRSENVSQTVVVRL